MSKTKYLHPECKEPQAPDWYKEEKGESNLDDIRGHNRQLKEPVWQVVKIPRQRGRDTLETKLCLHS